MSFDLYVWHESGPISADEARAKLERWGDDEAGVFAAHSAVGSFYAALIDRFPPLESFSAADIDRLGVWSVTPERSDEIVAAACVWSRADQVCTPGVLRAGLSHRQPEHAGLRRTLHLDVGELADDA